MKIIYKLLNINSLKAKFFLRQTWITFAFYLFL